MPVTNFVRTLGAGAALAAGVVAFSATAMAADLGKTLKTVQERGQLLCTGHNGTYLGFAEVDDKGKWKGFDIELCKALAVAIFGTTDKLKIVPISWAQRFPSIQSGDIDIIIKVTGWTMGRDTELGLQFSRPYFLGATQLMASKASGAKTAKDLDGATLCVAAGTSTERITADYLTSINVKYKVISFEKSEEMRSAYFAGRCDAFAGWGPNLAITRTKAKNPNDHVILPDIMAVEPESAAMRQGDDQWVDVFNWMMTALWVAEQHNITSENVDKVAKNPPNPSVGRMLGASPGFGKRLGLRDTWAREMIKSVGNYKQIFDRTLGDKSPYNLERGPNNLLSNGGAFYPLIID